MKNNPVQLRFKAVAKVFGVFPHPVNAYINFCLCIHSLRKIKSYNIGVEVMVKKLPVNFQ